MNLRSTFWIAAAALAAAAIALPIGLVAAIRSGDDAAAGPTTAPMPADHGEHGAPAPMDGVPDATASRGGQQLRPEIVNGVRVFRLTTKPVRWQILPGVRVTAWTYNGTVPGPTIRVPYGAPVRVEVTNDLPEPTTVHWHGLA